MPVCALTGVPFHSATFEDLVGNVQQAKARNRRRGVILSHYLGDLLRIRLIGQHRDELYHAVFAVKAERQMGSYKHPLSASNAQANC